MRRAETTDISTYTTEPTNTRGVLGGTGTPRLAADSDSGASGNFITGLVASNAVLRSGPGADRSVERAGILVLFQVIFGEQMYPCFSRDHESLIEITEEIHPNQYRSLWRKNYNTHLLRSPERSYR